MTTSRLLWQKKRTGERLRQSIQARSLAPARTQRTGGIETPARKMGWGGGVCCFRGKKKTYQSHSEPNKEQGFDKEQAQELWRKLRVRRQNHPYPQGWSHIHVKNSSWGSQKGTATEAQGKKVTGDMDEAGYARGKLPPRDFFGLDSTTPPGRLKNNNNKNKKTKRKKNQKQKGSPKKQKIKKKKKKKKKKNKKKNRKTKR